MKYSLEPRDKTFIKGYKFLPFAKNMGKNMDKNIKLINHAKQSVKGAPITAL